MRGITHCCHQQPQITLLMTIASLPFRSLSSSIELFMLSALSSSTRLNYFSVFRGRMTAPFTSTSTESLSTSIRYLSRLFGIFYTLQITIFKFAAISILHFNSLISEHPHLRAQVAQFHHLLSSVTAPLRYLKHQRETSKTLKTQNIIVKAPSSQPLPMSFPFFRTTSTQMSNANVHFILR